MSKSESTTVAEGNVAKNDSAQPSVGETKSSSVTDDSNAKNTAAEDAENVNRKRGRETGGKKTRKKSKLIQNLKMQAQEAINALKPVFEADVPKVNDYCLQEILQAYYAGQKRCNVGNRMRIYRCAGGEQPACSIYVPQEFRAEGKNGFRVIALPRDETQHGGNLEFMEIVQQSLDQNVNTLPSIERKRQWVARGQDAIKVDVLMAWHTFLANAKTDGNLSKEKVAQAEAKAQTKSPASSLAVEADGIGNASAEKDIQELKAEQVWIQ